MYFETGPSSDKPSEALFYRPLVEELRQLSQEKLQWTNDLGEKEEGFVYLLISGSDSQGKPGIVGHIHPNYEYSCIYCVQPGITLSQEVLEAEALARPGMKIPESANQKRFTSLVHETRPEFQYALR